MEEEKGQEIDILPVAQNGEEEMINLECSECHHGARMKFESNYTNKSSDLI